jgi:UDP-N-acetylglucosamine 4,6-dehydratase/5-epimerase
MSLDDKVVLLTGGSGSFGQKFTEIVLKEHNPRALRIFSRGELLQQEMRQKFGDDPRLRFFVGDVRDRDRVYRAMNGVNIVVHAAALKQVPTCEYNPLEAVKTNVDGAANVIDAAIDNGVEKVMAISTDKAVQPINLYGATKLAAEKLIIQSNVYSGARKTRFSCVRYGNVLGSRGSVIPLFLEQKKKGVITITDERMTRFWITLEQGVKFVLKCIDRMYGGEVFVPKLPSMKLIDMARVIAPGAKEEKIGMRPGEKLHEIMLTMEEAMHAREFEDFYVVEPDLQFSREGDFSKGKRLKEDFTYSSNENTQWLTVKELKKMLKDPHLL